MFVSGCRSLIGEPRKVHITQQGGGAYKLHFTHYAMPRGDGDGELWSETLTTLSKEAGHDNPRCSQAHPCTPRRHTTHRFDSEERRNGKFSNRLLSPSSQTPQHTPTRWWLTPTPTLASQRREQGHRQGIVHHHHHPCSERVCERPTRHVGTPTRSEGWLSSIRARKSTEQNRTDFQTFESWFIGS